ncbi:uncharacterized protein LOC125947258 [Dermacentor silvarum]|uniref:uncharacterized protein LOC125947258 n=1 Tax=Dermacentor silvarum TaxID=543639 RepID=UPI002100879B|nr:uncharacterized protein LOC125947258 [Dermacentor silvarum]
MENGEQQQRQQTSAPVTTLLPPPRVLDTTGDVWQSWKTWRQEFELFATATYLNQQPKERLMGRQARTLLPVTESHLRPQTIPPQDVQRRLHDIRTKQRSFYNRGTRSLPDLPNGSRVTVYSVPSKTWSPATVVKPANSPRAYIIETEEGLQLQRTREHLRLAPTPAADSLAPTHEHRLTVGTTEPQLRRSERNRRPPRRYPMPELP